MTRLPHCVHTYEDEATTKVCAFLDEKATPFDVRNMSLLFYPVFSSVNDILSRGLPRPPFVNNGRINKCKGNPEVNPDVILKENNSSL